MAQLLIGCVTSLRCNYGFLRTYQLKDHANDDGVRRLRASVRNRETESAAKVSLKVHVPPCTAARVHVPQVKTDDEIPKLRVGLICGGPSAERGISLNSARSVLDHLQTEDVSISCYYLDPKLRPYAISATQMYSNTPSDFDYKIDGLSTCYHSMADFLEELRQNTDIVFPVLHGKFGEDGEIQGLLESRGIPFIGSSAAAARVAFDKFAAAEELGPLGFATLPSYLIQDPIADDGGLRQWFEENELDESRSRVVVKPARAGSSVGVSIAAGVQAALRKADEILTEGIDERVVVEVFAEGGREFTAIILDNRTGPASHPVTLLPTEVELRAPVGVDSDGAIFDFRKKYLPTRQVHFHTPPRFSLETISQIRHGAARLFQLLGLRDFARVDGWLLPPSNKISLNSRGGRNTNLPVGQVEDGFVVFSDINLMSGMEQTSFLFQQAAKVGLSHAGVLGTILRSACSRSSRSPVLANVDSLARKAESGSDGSSESTTKQKVFVLFGGDSSERQVSLISGTNVWLNLRTFKDLDVSPWLLSSRPSRSSDVLAEEEKSVWALPYSFVLRHTVEEVVDGCRESIQENETANSTSILRDQVQFELSEDSSVSSLGAAGMMFKEDIPREVSLAEWIEEAKESKAVVFIAVHGGIGENGTLQSLLEDAGVPFTGSGIEASRLCIDKGATGSALVPLVDSGVFTARKKLLNVHDLVITGSEFGDVKSLLNGTFASKEMWDMILSELQSTGICVKPVGDGCSTGVARLSCPEDLEIYLKAVVERVPRLPPGSLSLAHSIIEMPDPPPKVLLLEAFVETDPVVVASASSGSTDVTSSSSLSWEGKSRWLEVTVGVIGMKGGMYALNPSITVKESGAILCLEEKFQGGTGINLTPPPSALVSANAIEGCRKRIELVANALGLEGVARIDAFMHADTGEIIVIEANTVPGMTPSTVLIHQALIEQPPMYPRSLFRKVVDLALLRKMVSSLKS
ncbi:hypothetical protein R1flu_007266 [Riccia fluitans]|uniref:ATP-grasp domain-containing protein n=1 Tax=Riccia fluitans TaxID=41844 RepID=A0ABD1Z1E5_9MARC